ncbi:MAG: hypothetical protein M0R03_20445, partial [Novosphingobium sp.]|nr:hypothetical protein [Novosphingobium sp.]
GINRVADASTPDPNQSVGGTEMAIAATNNALKPIYSGYIRIKELAARSMAIRIQNLIKYDKKAYEGYLPVIGGSGVKILSVGAGVVDADWEILIQAKPTQERKQTIMQAAMKAMQPDKDGWVGIEEGDFMMIERLLENGNAKLAEIMLNYRSKKNKERQLQIQRENMQIDSENQTKIAQTKAEEERKNKAWETEQQIKLEILKADLEDRNKAREHERKMAEISLDRSFDRETKRQLQTT